jgi:5-methylcytosine-specific restriction enzyme A
VTIKTLLADVLQIDPGQAVAGKARSPKWPRVQRAHLAKHPTCALCGGKRELNVHHVLPYHLFPDRELDRRNLVTLCRGAMNCHLVFGHLGNYSAFNPLVRADAEIWRFRLRAAKQLMQLAKREVKTKAKAKTRKGR